MFYRFLVILVVGMICASQAEDLYDNYSAVGKLNTLNFAKRITTNRKKGISIVHFYKDDDVYSSQYKQEYEDFATKNKGMYEIGAVNWDTNEDIWTKEGIKDFPAFRIYPPHPIPTVDVSKDDYSLKTLLRRASKFIESKVIEITSVNHDTFIKDNPAKAKVLLFTEKKDIPVIYKALSYNFDKTLFFGIVRNSEDNLVKKYKVKDFPTIYLINPGDKPKKFEGNINYYGIANFINVYSEIFDFGDQADQPAENAASKPWMSESLPELTKASSHDICLGNKGLWVLVFNKEKPSEGLIETLSTVRQQFTSNLDDRGIRFYFMWINADKHEHLVKEFEIEEYPTVIILNHSSSKMKYLKHNPEVISETSLQEVMNAITEGNARFKRMSYSSADLILK